VIPNKDGDVSEEKTEALVAHAPTFATISTLSELLLRAANRDREAFRELYSQIGPRLKGYVLRMCRETGLAEEITQEVLLTVWRRAPSYDPSRARAETWIFTIARNRTIDALRHRKVVEADHRDPHFVPSAPQASDRVIEARQQAEKIGSALAQLPEPQRDVLTQAFYEARSYAEIAEHQGVALGTVKSRARLAFQRLRGLLEAEDSR